MFWRATPENKNTQPKCQYGPESRSKMASALVNGQDFPQKIRGKNHDQEGQENNPDSGKQAREELQGRRSLALFKHRSLPAR